MFNKLKDSLIQLKLFLSEHPLFLYLLKIVFTLIVIIALFNYIDVKNLIVVLLKADISLILISIFLIIPNIYFQYKKWEITSKYFIEKPDKSKLLYSLFYGFTGGMLTPARIGEYAGRAIAFKEHSIVKVSSAIVIDKLSGMFIILSAGIFSLSILLIKLNKHVYAIYFILFLAMLIIILFLLFNKNRTVKIFKYNFQLNKEKISYKKLVLFSLLHYLCYLIQFGIFVIALGNTHLIAGLIAGSLMIFVKTFLPALTIGDLGLREGAAVFFLSFFNESTSVAMNASLLLFFINVFIPALAGSILLLKNNHAS